MNGYHFASRGQARTFASGAWLRRDDTSARAFESLALIANAPGALTTTTLTVQVRKALDAAGTGAVDVGPLVTKTAVGTQTLEYLYDVPSLGQDANGNRYTHVTLVTGGTTAATKEQIAVRESSRYSA